jgi:carbohydrate ABC transporter membrane protein 2, CUT1 family (TC 3.A.1.1.-)
MPNETKTAATTTAKASKIHDPMLTLQRAVAYIVLFVLCFICLFFFYVLIVNATHNNFTIQQGFGPAAPPAALALTSSTPPMMPMYRS